MNATTTNIIDVTITSTYYNDNLCYVNLNLKMVMLMMIQLFN